MGGNVTTKIPQGFSERQWKNLDPVVRKACEQNEAIKAGILRALEKGSTVQDVNDFYKDDAYIKGLIVERTDKGTVKPPPESTAELLGDKDFREVTTTQWEEYFRDRYSKNPDEARHDIVRVLCHKEVKQLQKTFNDLWGDVHNDDLSKRNAAIRLRLKYVNNHKEKQEAVDTLTQEYINQYKDNLKDDQLITDFLQAFAPETLKESIETNTEEDTLREQGLTPDDLKALAQFRALAKLPMSEKEMRMGMEELAIDAITERNINSGLVKVKEYQQDIKDLRLKNSINNPNLIELTETFNKTKTELEEQIRNEKDEKKKAELQKQLLWEEAEFNEKCDATLSEDVQKDIKKLEEKIKKASAEASDEESKFMGKNMDKLIEIAAEAQVQIDIQKHKYESTPAPQFADLDEDVQELVQMNPALFCDEITDPNDKRAANVTTAAGKKYVFNPKTFKEKMLEYSQAGKTSGDFQTNQEGCDYFCDLAESDSAFKGIVFRSVADGQETKRKVIKKAMEAAGITTEKDKTTQQRIAHVLKNAGIGALTGAGAVFVSDFMATLRTCEFTEKIYELASLTKMIPYEAAWSFEKTYHLEGNDGTYSGSGTLHVVGDDATYSGSGTLRVVGDDATYSGSGTLHIVGDDATYSGSGTLHIVGDDASWSDIVYVEDKHNGIIAGYEEVPVSGNDGHYDTYRDYHYKGNDGHYDTYRDYHYKGNDGHYDTYRDYHYKGNDGHYDTYRDYHYKGNDAHWKTEHHVKESGTVKGEVENPDADRELYEQKGERKRKFHPKFSSAVVYGYATAAGGISGIISGLLTMKKVRDKGLRRDAEVMRVISQKEIRNPEPPTPPSPPEQTSTINIDKVETPEREERTEETTTVPVEVNAPQRKGNRVYYQGWQTLQAAYEAPNSANFRNWFRNEFLGGKDIWETGTKKDGPKTQHFEKEIEYTDKKSGKTYHLTFNEEVFANAIDFYPINSGSGSGDTPSTGNTKPNVKVNIRKIPGTETYSGSITVKIGDKTYTASASGHTSEKAVKDALKMDLLKQGLSDAQVDKALREAVAQE